MLIYKSTFKKHHRILLIQFSNFYNTINVLNVSMTSTDLGKLLLISAELGDIKKVRRLLMNGAKIIKDSVK